MSLLAKPTFRFVEVAAKVMTPVRGEEQTTASRDDVKSKNHKDLGSWPTGILAIPKP
jgi:hypothetical protein